MENGRDSRDLCNLEQGLAVLVLCDRGGGTEGRRYLGRRREV